MKRKKELIDQYGEHENKNILKAKLRILDKPDGVKAFESA